MKTLKNKETGAIRRVENKEADMMTSGKNPVWGFVPKSEWKSTRKTNTVEVVDQDQPKRTKASKKNEEKKNRKGNQ
jgi:hypothetical protein